MISSSTAVHSWAVHQRCLERYFDIYQHPRLLYYSDQLLSFCEVFWCLHYSDQLLSFGEEALNCEFWKKEEKQIMKGLERALVERYSFRSVGPIAILMTSTSYIMIDLPIVHVPSCSIVYFSLTFFGFSFFYISVSVRTGYWEWRRMHLLCWWICIYFFDGVGYRKWWMMHVLWWISWAPSVIISGRFEFEFRFVVVKKRIWFGPSIWCREAIKWWCYTNGSPRHVHKWWVNIVLWVHGHWIGCEQFQHSMWLWHGSSREIQLFFNGCKNLCHSHWKKTTLNLRRNIFDVQNTRLHVYFAKSDSKGEFRCHLAREN